MPNKIITDSEAIKMARDYVQDEYLAVGEWSYSWEDPDSDPEDPDVIFSTHPPSDASFDYCYVTTECKIEKVEITERNAEEEEILLEVTALTKSWSGTDEEADELEDEDLNKLEEEHRTIWICLAVGIDDEWFVYNAEE